MILITLTSCETVLGGSSTGIDRDDGVNPACLLGDFVYEPLDTPGTIVWGDKFRAFYDVNCSDDPIF